MCPTEQPKEGSSHKLAYAKEFFLSSIHMILTGIIKMKIGLQEDLVGGSISHRFLNIDCKSGVRG